MATEHGITQTREVLQAVAALVGAVRVAADDGLDVGDIFALFGNADVRSKLILAADGIKSIQSEVANLDLDEIEELTGDAFDIIRAVVGKDATS